MCIFMFVRVQVLMQVEGKEQPWALFLKPSLFTFFFLRHGVILTKSAKYGGWPASPRDLPASAFQH